MFKYEKGQWIFYRNDGNDLSNADPSKSGKWMYFFTADGFQFISEICEKSIAESVVSVCKHTNTRLFNMETGVACFYINADDVQAHKRVISFFLENGLVPKVGSGRLKNISFKFDTQTRAGEYGNDFQAKIQLSDFVDLTTGEWL